MKNSPDFVAWAVELLGPVGGISVRAMFGGHGLFKEGRMFALIAGDVLYLKVDSGNVGDYQAVGAQSFRPFADSRRQMPYREVPAAVLEDGELALAWGRKAFEAALRART